MDQDNVAKVYADILNKYLDKFGLESIDIAFLIGTKKDVIDGLLVGKRGVVLKTLDKISQLFGLTYYQFGNPNHPMSKFDSLPERTKKRIAYRKETGPHKEETYNSLDINEKITIALSLFNENEEFLLEEIADIISDRSGDKTNTSIIGDRLSKSFMMYVSKTDKKGKSKSGRGRRPYYFRLTASIPVKIVDLAKEVVGEGWK